MKRKGNRHFMVIGWYDEELQRCADSYDTDTPEEAEMAFTNEYPGVNVAGVVEYANGAMRVVA